MISEALWLFGLANPCVTRDRSSLIISEALGLFGMPNPLIKLYPSEIFVSCCFCKDSLVSKFFFSLNLRHILKKNLISFCYCSKYISSIKNKKKREKREKQKKKLFIKTFIGFYRRKLNKRKLDQINSELAEI
jgi:hypothetical protein